MRIVWTPHARSRLRGIATYVRKDNPEAAARLVATIRSRVAHLSVHPAMGRFGRSAGTRELVIDGTPYIVPYFVSDVGVQVLSVQHAAQRWPDDLDTVVSGSEGDSHEE